MAADGGLGSSAASETRQLGGVRNGVFMTVTGGKGTTAEAGDTASRGVSLLPAIPEPRVTRREMGKTWAPESGGIWERCAFGGLWEKSAKKEAAAEIAGSLIHPDD